jgi:hypothetical protein
MAASPVEFGRLKSPFIILSAVSFKMIQDDKHQLVCADTRKKSSVVSKQNVKRNRKRQRGKIWNGQL